MKWAFGLGGFVIGFGIGVYITKRAAENKVTGGIHTVLDKVGLGGGNVESIVDQLVIG